MSIIEAIILGIVQGLTEFLPVSSSGHLELANAIMARISGNQIDNNLQIAMVVHGATVLSTITVFRNEILRLFRGFFKFRMNDEMRYMINIAISMIPILIVGLFFHDSIEALFSGNIMLVGCMLLVTAILLTLTHYTKPRTGKITPKNAFIIGIAQAIAVIPGLSRSGSTISTALFTGVERSEASKFSFLMVLIPIIGMNLLELRDISSVGGGVGAGALVAAFISAYVVGTLSCKLMVRIVNKGKLVWFAVYCAIVGIAAIVVHTLPGFTLG